MGIAAKLDDIGQPAWIGVMVLGFVLFWPVGLAILAYLIWSGRMMFWKRDGADETRKGTGHWQGFCGGAGKRRSETSGNTAFDEYRIEALRRLEEEQKEFVGFLDRLRQAKDKAEFDQFMAERRNGRRSGLEPQPQG